MKTNKEFRLDEIAKIDISGVDKKTKEGETPVKLCNFTDVYNNWAVTERLLPYLMIATANENEISRFSLKKGMIALTKDSETRDDIGMSTYIADDLEDTVLGYHTALIIPDEEKVDGSYLNGYLNSPRAKAYFSNQASGSGQRYTLTIDGIGSVKIALPELNEQKKIGRLLSAIDRKIELNKEINDNLQHQLELSFDYYFINPITSQSWRKGVLSDIANITMGQSPSGESYNDDGEGIPFYQGSTDFGSVFPMIRMYTTSPSRIANAMDTLLSVRAPVGTMNISFEECCIGRGLAAIRGNKNNNIFVRYLLKRNQWYFDNINNSGTTFGSITKDYLYKMPVTIPDDLSIEKFEDNAEILEQQIFNNEKEIRTLSLLRNWLLPMLMNGQATIAD